MISFLTPWFLWAAIAATIPLVLHMIQSRRSTRIPFSTIRFLKLAESRSSRRVKMENFLLWLLRTLLILCLVAAFAMPMLRTSGLTNFLHRAHRDVALILDTSYSMAYRTGRERVWDATIDSAVAIIEGLTAQDRICIFLAGPDVTPMIEQLSSDREGAIAQLKQLKPGHGIARLEPALIAANDALKEESRRREREIHIITDGQAISWDGFERWKADTLAKHTTMFVSLLGVPQPANICPFDVTLDPPVIMADMPIRVRAQLLASGTPPDTVMTLQVDGNEVERRAVTPGTASKQGATFTVPPLGSGVHTAQLTTPEDNLSIDNTLHFLIRTREHLPALCVGSQAATRFLNLALSAGETEAAGIALKAISTEALSTEPLASYACLFLCDALPLPGQDIQRIEQYVQKGGMLVIWPGNIGRPQDYAAWRCLPGSVERILDLPLDQRAQVLRWRQPNHPLLGPLQQGLGTPLLNIRRCLQWTDLADETETLITADNGMPFLLSRPFGRGQVFCLTVAADRSWSDFPLSPYFLPLAHQFVQYAAGLGHFTPFRQTAAIVSLDDSLPELSDDATLRDPTGNRVTVRRTSMDGATVLRGEGMDTPGIYTLESPAYAEPRPVLALNLPRDESDLSPITQEQIAVRLDVADTVFSHNHAELTRQIEAHRIGRTFGEALLWLALVLAVLEVVYGNMLVREVSTLTQTLGITPAGKVGGA